MLGNAYAISLLGAAFALIVLGGGTLAWLAMTPAEQITPAQDTLRKLADTMAKVGLGVLIGFFAARPFQQGNGAANRDS